MAIQPLPNPPTLIENGTIRFLIFDAPNNDNISVYLREFKRLNVSHVVRVCEATYSIAPLESAGIKVHDWPFPDGYPPPEQVINDWRNLLKSFKDSTEQVTIGVHCVAGLGRAPVLVAIALIESGMDNLEAVKLLRDKRRGCINRTQLHFLKDYKGKGGGGGCIVM